MPEPKIVTEMYGGRVTCTFDPAPHNYHFRVHGHVERLLQPSVTAILGQKAKPQLIPWAAKRSLLYVSNLLSRYESTAGKPPFFLDTKKIHAWIAEAADSWNDDESAATIGTVAHRFAFEELRYRAGLSAHRPKLPIVYDPVLMPNFTPRMVEGANASAAETLEFFRMHDLRPVILERPLWAPAEGFCGTPDFVGYIDGELCVADYKTSKRIYADYWAQLAALQHMYQLEFPEHVILKRYAINIPKDGKALQVMKRGNDSLSSDLEMFRACNVLYNWDRANDDFKKGSPIQILGDLDQLVTAPVLAQTAPEDDGYNPY